MADRLSPEIVTALVERYGELPAAPIAGALRFPLCDYAATVLTESSRDLDVRVVEIGLDGLTLISPSGAHARARLSVFCRVPGEQDDQVWVCEVCRCTPVGDGHRIEAEFLLV